MVVSVSMNGISASEPMRVKNTGARMATVMLEMMENVARRGTLPPSIPVITGAAVAVGQKTQMNVPLGEVGAEWQEGEVESHCAYDLHREQSPREGGDAEFTRPDTAECDEKHDENQVGAMNSIFPMKS